MNALRLISGLAISLLLASAMPVAAAPPVEPNRACADITDGDAGYGGTIVEVTLTTAEPSCKSVTYSLVVYDEMDLATVVGTASTPGNDTTTLVLTATVSAATDSDVCAVVTSMSSVRRIFDRGPDSGCVELTSGSSGAGGFH